MRTSRDLTAGGCSRHCLLHSALLLLGAILGGTAVPSSILGSDVHAEGYSYEAAEYLQPPLEKQAPGPPGKGPPPPSPPFLKPKKPDHAKAVLKGHEKEVYAVAFSSDGKLLVSAGADKTIRVWNLATGKEQAVLRGHAGEQLGLAISPDNKILASCGGEDREPELKLWDLATGKERASLEGHRKEVSCVTFAADG